MPMTSELQAMCAHDDNDELLVARGCGSDELHERTQYQPHCTQSVAGPRNCKPLPQPSRRRCAHSAGGLDSRPRDTREGRVIIFYLNARCLLPATSTTSFRLCVAASCNEFDDTSSPADAVVDEAVVIAITLYSHHVSHPTVGSYHRHSQVRHPLDPAMFSCA
jgi:hypothetical protein